MNQWIFLVLFLSLKNCLFKLYIPLTPEKIENEALPTYIIAGNAMYFLNEKNDYYIGVANMNKSFLYIQIIFLADFIYSTTRTKVAIHLFKITFI